jgi:hypothetical protein
MPRRVVGYDLMVHIGLERFLHHRQREEIRAALADDHGIVLSTGEISILTGVFLEYLDELHQASSPALRATMEADGGWPLHIDATGEDGRGTLLVAFSGWRQWVLGAWKIPTERSEAILPKLQSVVEHFGPPCAIMRDLGRAMQDATQSLVEELQLPIPILACHLHFLRDIGKDLLETDHDQLRALFRQVAVRSKLRSLARELGRALGAGIQQARHALRQWQTDTASPLPEGPAGLATVRALTQWILDYAADGTDEGFPFDLPWLALYDRCLQVCHAAQIFLNPVPADPQVHKALLRLQRILRPIECDDPQFGPLAETLTVRCRLFSELRQTLRLLPKASDHNKPRSNGLMTESDLQDIRVNLERLSHSLRIRRGCHSCSPSKGQAIDLILEHLETHGKHLWGHAILIPKSCGGLRLVARTNNDLESFFRYLKHGERRRSGRKVLTQDFEQLSPRAALAQNLAHADYVSIVCGSLQELPQAFAHLDRQKEPFTKTTKLAEVADPETASLSRADRRHVRSEGMTERIMAAAKKAWKKMVA